MSGHPACEELVSDGELVAGEAERFLRRLLVDAGDLVENAAGLDERRPLLDAALAATHAHFERLLRDGAIGEHADPELAGALHVALNRHTRGFDLTRRH